MEADFHKYVLKKAVWWGNGHYKIFNQDGRLIYTTKSKVFEFLKKIRMIPVAEEGEEWLVAAENGWMNSFNIFRSAQRQATLTKKSLLADGQLRLNSNDMGELIIKTNIWRTNFTFFDAEDEIALLSFKTWSTGEAGLVIKPGYEQDQIIASTIGLAFLKESGAI